MFPGSSVREIAKKPEPDAARTDAPSLAGGERRAILTGRCGILMTSAAAGLGVLVATIAAWTEWRLPDMIAQTVAWGLLPPQRGQNPLSRRRGGG